MEQFEQLLTCAICLDRYKNPKLLPCQHSFCMEPCMDGLVDYVRRQVKCPECRAEHRIPYQGVQGYPTNVTLQRFLELHIEITGELPDPTSGLTMKRCAVCSEKAYCAMCQHCDKEICPDCKNAHKDILRREISRINNQVRRALHRLEEMLSLVEKNMVALQHNCTSVSEEVEQLYSRLNKALKDRTEYLRNEVDKYLNSEHKSLSTLKENLEIEIANIQSNCDLADKYMQNEFVDWDDCELMDAKEIFLKTVEFVRYFESETGDYTRRVKFLMHHDPNQLVSHVSAYGDLSINNPQSFTGVGNSGASNTSLQPPGPGLMRSKSDHRLASQYRQQEERGGYDGDSSGRISPLSGRKFGERYNRDRYGRATEHEHDEPDNRSARSRLRARLAGRSCATDADSDTDYGATTGSRSVRFSEHAMQHGREREHERILDTEDVAKGPLSGITRLYDSPRVMKRLQESEIQKVKKEKEPPPVVQKFQPPKRPSTAPTPQRQMPSNDEDEISRIKRQNASTSEAANRISTDRHSAIRLETPASANNATTDNRREALVSSSESETDEEDEEEVVRPLQQNIQRRSNVSSSPATPRRPSSENALTQAVAKNRSVSCESSASSESSISNSSASGRSTGAAFTTEELKKQILARTAGEKEPPSPRPTFQSRFIGNRGSATPNKSLERGKVSESVGEDGDDAETESSAESEESSEEEEEEPVKKQESAAHNRMEKTDIGPLLARSAQARDNGGTSRRRDDGYSSSRLNNGNKAENNYKTPYRGSSAQENAPSTSSGRGASSKYLQGTRSDLYEPASQPAKSKFTSRFLNKTKSSAMGSSSVSFEDQDHEEDHSRSRHPTTYKEKRASLVRSKSSHGFGEADDEITEPTSSASAYYPASYLASKAASASAASDLARSRSTHAFKSTREEHSPENSSSNVHSSVNDKDGSSLSSWARYLKNKYGNRSKDSKDGTGSAPSSSRRLSSGVSSRHNSATSIESSDDDQKNLDGSPTSPTAAMAQAGFGAVGTTARSQYMQKRQLLYKIGSRGSEPGCFTWPRGIAIGPDNSIVVADSSNHRVQVFAQNGQFLNEFGSYGNGEGEFDCLAGIAVNRIGQFIIADRYNHRIQVLDPSGRFLRAFGSQGSADGKFNYPWGITTDALGFIYVCDKENHRIQVFQSDGTFVGKFGSNGNKIGQLEHPHYIAVSNTNRVIVSDSNNHRVQIFDVNGRVLSSIGSEGSANGQFKFPRGVAVDDQGYILVGDSGNNRIQIFHADGTFLRSFGCWGSGDGEFKGLEGVAVMSNGNILVCDRENHRIQVF